MIDVLLAYSGRPIRVEGHTDAIASETYSQTLSEKRARSVATWLSKSGLDTSSFDIVGHGESQPVADNGTAEGRQLNRRVEIVIQK